jgi:NOL1/NOP2/sun family putative RNA methylase
MCGEVFLMRNDMHLPDKYVDTMKGLLGDEFDAYIESFNDTRLYGLRVNTMKLSVEEFLRISPFELTPVPWIENGFYYCEEDKPAKHPYYYAGLYYIQEPSAMTPANVLPIDEGDLVFDMCAAPGGKSTELGARLNRTGMLVTNDISNSRAKALLKNVEVFGIPNVVVMSEDPKRLVDRYRGCFDKVMIDAPCSGEGMFRKDGRLIKSWERNGPEFYHEIQKSVLLAGADMLRPGGIMQYSTCTFSRLEDEESIKHLLRERPDMELISVKEYEGFGHGFEDTDEDRRMGLSRTVRIWPHRMGGEGHFVSLIRKCGDGGNERLPSPRGKGDRLSEELLSFLDRVHMDIDVNDIRLIDDRAFLIPDNAPELSGIRTLRTGLLLGEEKKKRFEPSQALAMALRKEEYDHCLDLSVDDERVMRYLKGETLELLPTDEVDGSYPWQLVCVSGYPLGWGKLSNGSLKNKYLAGWRMM